MTSLKHLDLSDNDLSELHINIFNPTENLTSFSISHNSLHTLPVSKFKNLKQLDISYNLVENIFMEILDLAKNGSDIKYNGKIAQKLKFLCMYCTFFNF